MHRGRLLAAFLRAADHPRWHLSGAGPGDVPERQHRQPDGGRLYPYLEPDRFPALGHLLARRAPCAPHHLEGSVSEPIPEDYVEDDVIWPLMVRLRDCLCAELTQSGLLPGDCFCGVLPGDQV